MIFGHPRKKGLTAFNNFNKNIKKVQFVISDDSSVLGARGRLWALGTP
jgi:hypothetical protein